jgi:hypothetical protein
MSENRKSANRKEYVVRTSQIRNPTFAEGPQNKTKTTLRICVLLKQLAAHLGTLYNIQSLFCTLLTG